MSSKSLTRNAIYNIIYKMLNIVFPLLTSAYVARILMAESIGRVAAAQNIASYFTLVASMGIPTYGVKLIAQFKVKTPESWKAFKELFFINGIFSLACSVAYYIFVLSCSYFDGKEVLYCIVGLNVLFNIINVDWFYQGIQEYGYIAFRSFLIKCVSLFCLIVFVRDESDYIVYALISTGALVGNYIFNMLKIRQYFVRTVLSLELSKHIKHILVLFAASIAAEIYVLADTTMLDFMCNSSIVGYYTMSMKIIKLIRSLMVAVAAVFLPQLSYLYYTGRIESFYKLANRGAHILMALTLPAAVGVLFVADDAILVLFGTGFTESILTTKILSFSIVTVAVSNYIGMQILITLGREKITSISTVCGACCNILLNCMLIPVLQHNGAAIASVITEGAVMIIQLLLSRKYIHIIFNLKKPVISAGIMAVVLVLIRQLQCGSIIRLILSCVVGFISYVLLMVMQKDDFAIVIKTKIMNQYRKV